MCKKNKKLTKEVAAANHHKKDLTKNQKEGVKEKDGKKLKPKPAAPAADTPTKGQPYSSKTKTQTTPEKASPTINNNNNNNNNINNDKKMITPETKPMKNLPPAEENDTVYGYKSSISEHIFDKDPGFESSENEKVKLFITKK